MRKINFTNLCDAFIITMALFTSVVNAQNTVIPKWKINPDKELNPNTKWLIEAKWGLFAHYLGIKGFRRKNGMIK